MKHLAEKSLIDVLLFRPVELTEKLSGLSEVAEVREVADSDESRIEVVLSVASEIAKEREAINLKANRIASRIVTASGTTAR